MDTTKTNGTAQHKNRAGTRKNLLKFMFFLFILHAIVTFLSHGTGVVETFRSFLIHVFWPPEGWAGETLPVHQQLKVAQHDALRYNSYLVLHKSFQNQIRMPYI